MSKQFKQPKLHCSTSVVSRFHNPVSNVNNIGNVNIAAKINIIANTHIC